jgi:uncharacterized protein (DUF1501 family)
MLPLTRRELLTWFAIAPTLPRFLVDSAEAAVPQAGGDHPIVVVVRMLGGNDGLNAVVPFTDDRYYRARPTIAIPRPDVLPTHAPDHGLNPYLTDVRRLMDDGHAGIVQSVGWADSSRSHIRATEIWETGSVSEDAPAQGWLGRYLDHACDCGPGTMAGLQFGDDLGRTLASAGDHSRSIGNPQLLLAMKGGSRRDTPRGSRPSRLDYLQQMENALGDASRQLHKASKGRGNAFNYPSTAFGQSLRWAGDMIETGCPTRVYYATIGSFDTPESASFDTHIDQLAKHRLLFSELGQGFRAFRDHMVRAGQFNRVLLLTFSDFGRMVAENKTRGTEHGDASILFYLGGRVRPGLVGEPSDLGRARDGAIPAAVDFRQVYADVLTSWLRVDPNAILGQSLTPFSIVSA